MLLFTIRPVTTLAKKESAGTFLVSLVQRFQGVQEGAKHGRFHFFLLLERGWHLR